jgi:hypothetical protein
MEDPVPINQCMTVGWSILIAFMTFFFGFIANKLLSKNTANRKEDHELIYNISEIVAKIENKAYAYYSLPGNDAEAKKIASEIRSVTNQMARQVQVFSELFTGTKVNSHVIKLRQAVTSELDNSERNSYPDSSPIFQEISDQCRILIGDLNLSFNKRYRFQ